MVKFAGKKRGVGKLRKDCIKKQTSPSLRGTKQSGDVENVDCFVILPRNDAFS